MEHPFLRTKRLLLVLIILGLSACSGQGSSNASTAVENYLTALVAKDANQIINYSCAAWEENARQELRTFDAITVKLQDLSCQESGQEGETNLVSCTGKIVANYGNEILEIDLSERDFQAVNEGGEWRMCGYR